MEGKSEAERQALDAQARGQDEAKKVCDEAWARAEQAYKEAKKQADIVHKELRKIAVDRQAKKVADKAHKNAIAQAKKVRAAIIAEAMAVFRSSYDQATTDYIETTTKSQEAIKDADETYKEAKKQANIVYKEAKKRAVDKQAKKEANEAHKKAIDQAKQVRDEATKLTDRTYRSRFFMVKLLKNILIISSGGYESGAVCYPRFNYPSLPTIYDSTPSHSYYSRKERMRITHFYSLRFDPIILFGRLIRGWSM